MIIRRPVHAFQTSVAQALFSKITTLIPQKHIYLLPICYTSNAYLFSAHNHHHQMVCHQKIPYCYRFVVCTIRCISIYWPIVGNQVCCKSACSYRKAFVKQFVELVHSPSSQCQSPQTRHAQKDMGYQDNYPNFSICKLDSWL